MTLQAANGKELLDRLQPHQLPDIVVTDLNMPVMNGYELMARMSQQHPAVKLLALSMYDSQKRFAGYCKPVAMVFSPRMINCRY